MLVNWPRHNKWHKQVKKATNRWRPLHRENDCSLAELASAHAEETGDEYLELLADAISRSNRDDLQGAVRTLRKIIRMQPERPEAYLNLGTMLVRSGKHLEAPQMYLRAMELEEDGTRDWAVATARAFATLATYVSTEVPKPEWWTDEGLKVLSEQVVAAGPNESEACTMRGHVLAANVTVPAQVWEMAPRTADEVTEAATWYRRASAVNSDSTHLSRDESYKATTDQFANWCDKAVANHWNSCDEACVEAAGCTMAEASAARHAIWADEKASREAAEAKAAAAAEELLAEEAKEKEQAAAKNKAGNSNTKGKGKKGKGGRR